ncbi:hypothetical protein [Novipirellula caenicola]|uniref:Lipopolysaccharide assembly protein A domain-containing protein n=1 Tax=Novipirellula caenicola TaxID=1536901 RepID=A0ABP9VQZ8_9BACT
MMQKIRWILLLLGIVIALVIAFQNNRNEEVNVLFFHGEVSLLLLILTAVGVGFVFGAMLTYGMLRPKKGKKTNAKSAAKGGAAAPAAPTSKNAPPAPKPERADALAPDRADAKK